MANKHLQLRRAKKKALKETKRKQERKVVKELREKNKLYNAVKYRNIDGVLYPHISTPRDFVKEYKDRKKKKGGDKIPMMEENFKDGGNPVVEKNRIPNVILADGMTQDMLNNPQTPKAPEGEDTETVVPTTVDLTNSPTGGNGKPPKEVESKVTPKNTTKVQGQGAK